jgi:basic amino acid/polyamine antiporter, APA family
MLTKAAAIALLVVAGLFRGGHAAVQTGDSTGPGLVASLGAAMIPVAFAYGGWQTASFVAAEMRDPRRDLSRGLIMGVSGVVLLYAAVNFVCVRVLGPAGLALTATPASAVMRAAMGDRGGYWIALGIAVSTLGFLSQSILTAPRVYYAMARDGLFFERVGRLSPRSGAPVTAILLQGFAASAIAVLGRYEQILNYVTSIDFISFALTSAAVFVLRRRPVPDSAAGEIYRVPGHPFTTGLFVLAAAGIVVATFYSYPQNSVIGLGILAAGIPVYLYWSRRRA